MPRREGAAHVVTTKRVYKGRVYETHLLRRTYRQGGKVKNLTLANLSHLPNRVSSSCVERCGERSSSQPKVRSRSSPREATGTWRR
ncbi:MAG: hypothetical protein ACUVYA_19340, partial [Planctomycetota bacterium]